MFLELDPKDNERVVRRSHKIVESSNSSFVGPKVMVFRAFFNLS